MYEDRYLRSPTLKAPRRAHSVRFRLTRTVPLEVGLAIGDCVHNLRSALDHAVWQIVPEDFRSTSTEQRLRRLSFSIRSKLDTTWQSIANDTMPKTAELQRAIIQGHQPFEDPVRNGPLALLQDLDNTDKHQVIVVTVVRLRTQLKVEDIFIQPPDSF